MKYKTWSFGVIGSVGLLGFHTEYRFNRDWGFRVAGMYLFGIEINNLNVKEYIITAMAFPVFHIPSPKKFLDPILMFGLTYSYHHWSSRINHYIEELPDSLYLKSGNFHDITGGCGLGLGFIPWEHFRIGINLWVNFDYIVKYSNSGGKKKGGRTLLFAPALELSALF